MKLIIIALAALALAGCDYLETVRTFTATGVSHAVVAECGISLDQRRANLDAINNTLAEQGRAERAMALDCNGDGQADF